MKHISSKMYKSKVFIIISHILFFISVSSCSKEEISDEYEKGRTEQDNNSYEKEEESVFYVKYEMEVDYGNSNHVLYLKLEYTSESGYRSSTTQKIERRKKYSWDGVYGPFKKSQTVTFDCNSQIGESPRDMNFGVGDYYGRIYVKEGNGEFVVKAEGTDSKTGNVGLIYSRGLHLKYTIK